LAEVAHEAGVTDAVRRDLRLLQTVSERVPEFLAAMRNPVVPQETKRTIVDDLSRRCGFQKYFAQFLRVLVEHHRIVHVNAIGEMFDEEADALSGVVRARRPPPGRWNRCGETVWPRTCAGSSTGMWRWRRWWTLR